MANQQSPSKRPHSESLPLPSSSPSKDRRLEAPVTPPDSTKDVESDSSPPGPKQQQQQQPKSASNSTTTTALSQSVSPATAAHISKPPVVARPDDYTGMSLEERVKLIECIVERDAELLQWKREHDQQTEKEFDKMSRAEWEQWSIEFGKKHSKIIRHCGRFKANIARRNNQANSPSENDFRRGNRKQLLFIG